MSPWFLNIYMDAVTKDESVTYRVECSRKLASERRVAGVIRYLVNARDFQFACASLA